MENLFSNRLISARKLEGLSLRGLASKLPIELSAQAISFYEKGKRKPDSPTVIALSNALNVPVDYFFRDSNIELGKIEFRKKSKLGNKKIEQIKEYAKDYLERYLEIERILNISDSFQMPEFDSSITNSNDIEKSALDLRNSWDLGINPIPNILGMFEEKGVKIVEIENVKEFDGFSVWLNSLPVIVLNKAMDIVRKRFTALHELAHLFLIFKPDILKKTLKNIAITLQVHF